MSRWFRMYSDVLDDPKVQKLPAPLFKVWVNLLCLASRNDGVLPGAEDIAFALRMDENVTRDMLRDLSQRCLLDDGENLSPHNWSERQFKSDHDQTATERKRAQRARERQANVTEDVTRDSTVTSHPPEQNRTEQSRAEQSDAHTQAEEGSAELHQEIQRYLDNHTEDLTQWEERFLISIKWNDVLSKAQKETLTGIRQKLAPKDGAKPLPSVRRGTPQYDAWIAYYKRTGRPTAFYEKQDAFTVLSEYPPQEKAA